ncbi:Adhesion G protein-coupled receptor A1 [Nymphon striatum]|nr:Adhesion G protein-coupled receptor A1 [Nymphon striatum]
MPAEAKHSMVNTWIAIILLCIIFSIGIRFTQFFEVCQAIGILINYFSLCVPVWIIVSLGNVYSTLYKPEVDLDNSSEDNSDLNIPKKPMIRFYLVGWGIPSIICGISAAVNLHLYGSSKLCMLPIDQSILALFIPSAIFIFTIACMFLRNMCLLSDVRSGNLLHEIDTSSNHAAGAGAEIESNVNEIEVEAAEEQALKKEEIQVDDEDIDEEHSYSYQINAQVLLLIMYVLSWGFAFLYIANPPIGFFKGHEEIIYSSLYCAFTTILGLYIFACYCCCRSDVRECLAKMFCLKTKDSLSSQQQSDITITTMLTQGEDSEADSKYVNKTLSPPPLEKVDLESEPICDQHIDINSLDDCVKAVNERADKKYFLNTNHGRMSPIVQLNGSIGHVDRQQIPLNRDSSNSVSSVATTERSRYTYQTMQSMNGYRSQSPFTNLRHIHQITGAAGLDPNYYDPRQQNVARKFFQKQRDKRRQLKLHNIGKSESSQFGDSTCLDTSIDTSLVIPKQQSENEVPIVEINGVIEDHPSGHSGDVSMSDKLPSFNQNEKFASCSPAKSTISNGHIHSLPSPNRQCTPNALEEGARMLSRPNSAASLSKRSCQSECIGKKQHKRRRRHKDSKGRGSSLSVVSNGSYSYPLRTRVKGKSSSSKLRHSISDYEQIDNKNYDSTSSDEGKKNHRRPRIRQKNKHLLKKETSV